MVKKKLKGKIPSKPEELSKLPGVGPYTAGAISSIAFNRSVPLVDGNVQVGLLHGMHGFSNKKYIESPFSTICISSRHKVQRS